MRSFLVPFGLAAVACAAPNRPEPVAAAALSEPRAATDPPAVGTPLPCPDDPGLCFIVEPADAEIVLNDEGRGTVAALGAPAFMSLAPGIYQITLRRQGFATWRAEVSVRSAAERIDVKLVPK